MCERIDFKKQRVGLQALDLMEHVDVYGKPGRWSIRQRGIVRAYATDLFLTGDVRFMVSRATFERLQREGRRGICAWARGFLAGSAMGLDTSDLVRGRTLPAVITYDRELGLFRCDNLTRDPLPVAGAASVAFSDAGCTAAYTFRPVSGVELEERTPNNGG
jgi:hypothetical protein